MPQDPTGNASTIARTPLRRTEADAEEGRNIGSAQGNLSLSPSLFRVPCLYSRSPSASFSPPCLHPPSPFRRANTLFLSYARACTHTRSALFTFLIYPLSFTRARSFLCAGGTLSLCDPASLPAHRGRREPTERENRSSTMSYPNPNPSASPGVHTRPSGTHFSRSGSWVTATARSLLAVNRTQGFNTACAIIVENVIKRLLFCEIIKGVRVS